MARIEKTVFISYRRADRWQALAVFKDLTQHGYDVFIDYDGIASGDFERAIIDNIRARAHFIVVLTPMALKRCDKPTDWLRREIEVALEAKRNIVPLLFDGFRFDAPIAVQRLQGSLEPFRRYQALDVPADFFDAAMERLRGKRLAAAVEAVLHPASAHAQQVANEQRDAAVKAAALVPAEEKTVAHSAPPTTQQPAQGGHAAVATNEGQAVSPEMIDRVAAATPVVPAHAKPYARFVGLLSIVLAAIVVWFLVSSGGKKQVEAPSAAATPSTSSGGKKQEVVPSSAIAPRLDGPTDAVAQNALAEDYYFGQNGRTQDDAEAVKWYRKAAEQGYAHAQAQLGFMYLAGRGGLAKDDTEAVKWYRKAAEQGNWQGQTSLGFMYGQGRGLVKDEAEAVRWYRKAAEPGYALAQANLAFMYREGQGGLAKDDTEAVKWYRKAAAQGLATAQASLGDMYEKGRGGLTPDRAQAVKLYRQAAGQGSNKAKEALERMGEK